eukprot:TRINITY_DN6284_c0_g4_i1.p1 TRINITY_DN6284_c0_g4~~TRINITY_DN6284_c0_g4_i1.p1  ORF type:complete len:429 (+),score=96.06 TRINITY_DN6284_c0_g4_i1:309-1595(+)
MTDITIKKKRVLRQAIEEGYLGTDESPAMMFFDLDMYQNQIQTLQSIFPDNTLHAQAVKANPLINVIKTANSLGLGSEAASIGEVHVALAAGVPPDMIVFDSPAKTISEIHEALQLGITLFADNFDELERIIKLYTPDSQSRLGVRVNPVVGVGTVASHSTGTLDSKFGVNLVLYKEEVLEFYAKYGFLTCISYHVGSQGMNISQMTKGAQVVTNLLKEINQIKSNKGLPLVDTIDIGGGISVDYNELEFRPKYQEYFSELKSIAPDFFNGDYKIITEFGRSLNAKSGWTASKIEYMKKAHSKQFAVVHVGADLFLREAYVPDDWYHIIDAFSMDRDLETAEKVLYDIAGPLCFSGDVIGHDIKLPELVAGDYVIVYDTGAYCLSMYSRYNSRRSPGVLGYRESENGDIIFEILRQRETTQDIIKFWS